MRSYIGLLPFILISLLLACSPRSGPGRTGDSGSDIVQPLWAEQNHTDWFTDTGPCTNVVALLIGIGQYDSANGWESLSAGNDVVLMTATLRKRGVKPANIHILSDRQATKTGIEKALETLADTVPQGAELIVLYAGHARQLPDDTGDETDGYDEAIVPYDAPPANQTQPDAYLRDDALNRYLTRIRTKLGSTGSLWLLFDACHSQTLNRGQIAQRIRGGIAPMGLPVTSRSRRSNAPVMGSDWYELASSSPQLAPYVLFAATTDGGPTFETTNASGQSLGPLTRAVCEAWANAHPSETYRSLFNRTAAAMARYAPYQQPGLEGDADLPTPGCSTVIASQTGDWHTIGEPLRVAWSHQDMALNRLMADLPFVQSAGAHPDLHIDRRSRGYRLWSIDRNQPLAQNDLSAEECAERIRQYFARNVLLQLQQTSSDFQVKAVLQRVAVRIEQGRTVVTDTLPDLTTSGLPCFQVTPSERLILTLTNTGPKPVYLTIVDLQSDGTLHVLLPGDGQSAMDTRLVPGQTLRQRIRITEPTGAEVYKILLTPAPIDLRAVLQTRGASTPGTSTPGASTPGASTPGASTPGASTPGASTPGASTPGASTPGNTSAQHPYEAIFQRTYATRGMLQTPITLLGQTGATMDVAFWVRN